MAWTTHERERLSEAIHILGELQKSLDNRSAPCECCSLTVFENQPEYVMVSTIQRSIQHLEKQDRAIVEARRKADRMAAKLNPPKGGPDHG